MEETVLWFSAKLFDIFHVVNIHYASFNWSCCCQALVDGPCSGVRRRDINFKALELTQFVLKLGPSARTGTVRKAWEKEEITKKWGESSWAKKIAARKRVSVVAWWWCSFWIVRGYN